MTFPNITTLPENISIRPGTRGYWDVYRDGERFDGRCYHSEADAIAWTLLHATRDAAMSRVDAAVGDPSATTYTRGQYEAACAALDLTPAADEDLGNYADRFGWTDARLDAPLADTIALVLRKRRLAGLDREGPQTSLPATAPAARVVAAQDVVPDMLGLSVPSDATMRGVCHYCGRELVHDVCEECR